MANILDVITIGDILHVVTDSDPSAGAGTPSPIGSVINAIDGSGMWYKFGALDTNYAKLDDSSIVRWAFNGNSVGAVKSIGTIDNFDLPFITNNLEVARLKTTSNLKLFGSIEDNVNVVSIAPTTRRLFDTTSILSMDWQLRRHNDVLGTAVLDWTNTGTQGIGFLNVGSAFTGFIKNTNLTANRTFEFPNGSGIFVVSSGVLTGGSVIFANASGVLVQDNPNLFFDDLNNRLGIGTNTPSAQLNVIGLTNIGNATAIGQRQLRVGQGTSFMDFGEFTAGFSSIWMLSGTPSGSNFTFRNDTNGVGTETAINAPNGTSAQLNFYFNGIVRHRWTSATLTFTPLAAGQVPSVYTFNTPTNSNQTASAERSWFVFGTSTQTINWLTGTVPLSRATIVNNYTATFVAASTITDAVTFEIVGAPIVGTNATFTRSWGARIFGNALFGSSVTFGDATGIIAPTAFIDITPSLAGTGSIRLRSGASVIGGGLLSGVMWNDSTRQALQVFVSGFTQSLNTTMFVQTADKNINTSVVETTLFGTGIGTLTLPADALTISKTLRLTMRGFFSRTSGNITIRFKLGGTTIVATATASSGAGANDGFEIVVDLTTRTIGAGGSVIAQGRFTNLNTGGILEMVSVATTAINTTIAQIIDLTLQFSISNAGNTITSTNTTIEVFD